VAPVAFDVPLPKESQTRSVSEGSAPGQRSDHVCASLRPFADPLDSWCNAASILTNQSRDTSAPLLLFGIDFKAALTIYHACVGSLDWGLVVAFRWPTSLCSVLGNGLAVMSSELLDVA
jgi:hypothetical protein